MHDNLRPRTIITPRITSGLAEFGPSDLPSKCNFPIQPFLVFVATKFSEIPRLKPRCGNVPKLPARRWSCFGKVKEVDNITIQDECVGWTRRGQPLRVGVLLRMKRVVATRYCCLLHERSVGPPYTVAFLQYYYDDCTGRKASRILYFYLCVLLS